MPGKHTPLPELLAPAGSPEALRAAIEAGADAVYLGGSAFNARAFAVNFTEEAMEEAIALCRLYGVATYVTLNTLQYDKEMAALRDYAAALHRMGVSGVIVADRGVMAMLHREIPALALHASTQASCHSTTGARALAEAGARRVVLARELSLPDIQKITAEAGIETEIFVHGALCVSHSGQCLFSSLVGGRSGNRGACAGPCRLPYNGRYPLSLRDLSLAAHIPALIESGVASLKIEGRMKSAAYVYGVTAIYRRLLDERRAAYPAEEAHLRELFSRTGFTDRYFTGTCEKPMTGIRREQDKSDSRRVPDPPVGVRKIATHATLSLHAGQAAAFSLYVADGREAHVTGDIPQPAIHAALTAEAVRERLSRMGATPFFLAPQDIALDMEAGLNLSPGAINALRRGAVEALRQAAPVTTLPKTPYRLPPRGTVTRKRTALFLDARVAAEIGDTCAYFDTVFVPLAQHDAVSGFCPDGVYLPPVVPDKEMDAVLSLMQGAREAGIRHALVGNIGMIAPARDMGFTLTGDFRLNILNRESAAAYRAIGVEDFIASPELRLPQLRDLGDARPMVYGYLPMMLTERCFIKENFGCASCGKAVLRDRRGAAFPLVREYPHRNLILNSLPTYMGDKQDLLAAYDLHGGHFFFSIESAKEARAILDAFCKGRPLAGNCRRIAK